MNPTEDLHSLLKSVVAEVLDLQLQRSWQACVLLDDDLLGSIDVLLTTLGILSL